MDEKNAKQSISMEFIAYNTNSRENMIKFAMIFAASSKETYKGKLPQDIIKGFKINLSKSDLDDLEYPLLHIDFHYNKNTETVLEKKDIEKYLKEFVKELGLNEVFFNVINYRIEEKADDYECISEEYEER